MSRNFAMDESGNVYDVASREGRVSRNSKSDDFEIHALAVASREGRVSRNLCLPNQTRKNIVASREGRVSRNSRALIGIPCREGRVPRGTCE